MCRSWGVMMPPDANSGVDQDPVDGGVARALDRSGSVAQVTPEVRLGSAPDIQFRVGIATELVGAWPPRSGLLPWRGT